MNLSLFVDIRKEFSVDDSGITYNTKRALAKLCGVKINYWGRTKNSFFNKELDDFIIEELDLVVENQGITLLETLVSKGLIIVEKRRYLIQDVLSSLVIEFYATVKKTPEAKATNRALRAVGFRHTIHQLLNWQPPTSKDYSRYLLKAPRVWTKVFEDDIYDDFARLTGLTWDKRTHRKPCLFAKLTYDMVYRYLPQEVYNTIKQTQEEHGGYIHKIHEFLSPDGLESLKFHLTLVANTLSGCVSIYEAKRHIHQSITKEYQLSLFGR